MKIRDLKITRKMADKHKKTMIALYIITYILLFPFVLLDYLSDFLEWLCNKMSWFRTDIIYTTLKIIYKKEIIAEKNKDCDMCIKKKTMECPNSSLCYNTENKPYFKSKLDGRSNI